MSREFIDSVVQIYNTGKATEHSYRPALQKLFNSLDPNVVALNEPQREHVGAPDFSISRDGIVIGHCEAKDVPVDLKSMNGTNLEQLQRYSGGLQNLLYTNCIDWLWYRDGQLKHQIRIATLTFKIEPIPESFDALEALLREFIAQSPQTINSSRALAERMAGKAILIRDILANSLHEDRDATSELANQYGALKQHLIHDISVRDFADIYAETITYGMFAARLNDPSLDTFSRQEALDLLPKSNPFLRNLFSYVAGPNLDQRISWIIDDLARVFQASNVSELMVKYGKTTQQNDPFLHFYEDFLTAYNPQKRDARGVWYTPISIVNFIVRAVDDILQSEFGLPEGLADTSRVNIPWFTGQNDKKGKPIYTAKEIHRVQILDPATGTGTFLAEVFKTIAPRIKAKAPGLWATYVENDMIPRVHGFELLMASYAMCHLKLDMVLRDYGYQPTEHPPRMSVYLTNSLEEGDAANQTLPFAQWLSNEVRDANKIKRDVPIMCIIGNPPYNIQSGNLAPDQVALIEKYRYVDGAKIKEKGALQFEKNINNDYIKFIALAEQMICQSGYGIIGFITSHGYLKSASFRGMRQHLLHTFHTLYILDLHGNSEVKEVTPPGVIDKNVFDIKQGVCILIAVRKVGQRDSQPATVRYGDLWGSRAEKYDYLSTTKLSDVSWIDCSPAPPNFTFHPSGAFHSELVTGTFGVQELFSVYSSGVITARDKFAISESPAELIKRARDFSENTQLSDSEVCRKLGIRQKKGWDVAKARARLRSIKDIAGTIKKISYRPFDERQIIFDESVVWTTARSTMDHMLRGPNLALVTARSEKSGTCSHFMVSKNLVETKFGERTTQSAVFPLYLYPDPLELDQARRTNFNPIVFSKLKKLATHKIRGEPNELAIFDYVYGVLHCPAFRQKYAEFLKIDFPRIKWPKTPDLFWNVSDKGRELRELHLMNYKLIGDTPYPFIGEGDGKITEPVFCDGHVWINKTQRFENAPIVSWNFYLGGYQPAQKWLKDRKGSVMSFEQVQHYQRILKVLAETDRIMQTIPEAE